MVCFHFLTDPISTRDVTMGRILFQAPRIPWISQRTTLDFDELNHYTQSISYSHNGG